MQNETVSRKEESNERLDLVGKFTAKVVADTKKYISYQISDTEFEVEIEKILSLLYEAAYSKCLMDMNKIIR